MHRFSNSDLATIFTEMAALFEIQGVLFKPAAYERAALAIQTHGEEAVEIYKRSGVQGLMEIPGVGKGIAEHIEELLATGHFREYEALKKKFPVKISELIAVEGVGPKMVKVLWEKLKIKNLADLERAARAGKIRRTARFGEKSERKILKGIEFLKQSGNRRVLGFLMPEFRKMEEEIRAFSGVENAVIAGSVRRRKETIGDIDILAASEESEPVMEQFLRMSMIAHVYASGPTKTNVRLKNGLDADLRVVPKKSWGAALNYFTGSKEHNVALREIAMKKGWKLNEYGLYRGKTMIAGETEDGLYKKLGLRYIEPEMRENKVEIEAARKNELPRLIGYDDLKGDLQVQTDWTDGQNSIEEMAHAAAGAGLEYIVITDHTKSLAMTGGSDEKKLLRQMKAIDRFNTKFQVPSSKFRILKGAEVNIQKDGSLDIADDVLSQLDVAGAAVHSHFNLPIAEQTKRLIRVMENPHVDIIFHLTGRVINRRGPIQLDIDEIIKAAKRTATVLEIDAYPDRLDIRDEYVRKCVEVGVKMAIDSDAHSVEHFAHLEIGIAQARRGWATKNDIINAWPLRKMLSFLK